MKFYTKTTNCSVYACNIWMNAYKDQKKTKKNNNNETLLTHIVMSMSKWKQFRTSPPPYKNNNSDDWGKINEIEHNCLFVHVLGYDSDSV